MSKRNFILLIITLVIAVIAVLGFLYFRESPIAPGEEGQGTNFISRFNPFGPSKITPPAGTPTVDVSGYEPGLGGEIEKTKLVKVSSMPIAGFGVFQKERLKAPMLEEVGVPTSPATLPGNIGKEIKPAPPKTEFAPALRYVDKGTGNIYQTFADKTEERRFSGTIIPKVYEAHLGNRGESVVMRYLKAGQTIETFVGALSREYLGENATPDNEVKGSFLPQNVKDISVSPDASKIFYLFDNGNNMVGVTLNLSNNKKVQVFDSPFTEWLSQWPNDKMITLSTKPSGSVPGHVYALNLVSRNLTKILGGVSGLTTLTSPNGKLVLYGDNNLSLFIYHTDSRNSDLLGVKTLPEKCVWGGDAVYCAVPKFVGAGEYPDAWYQGEASFSDRLWKIDIKTGNGTMLLDPAGAGGGEIDGVKLALDESENYLFFVNKKDSFLWKLDFK